MIMLIGCSIIVGALVGGTVLFVRLSHLQRALERQEDRSSFEQ
jgi:uncharacterized integral membrane protein